jgi:type II secretory pathway pseudopilin PulG
MNDVGLILLFIVATLAVPVFFFQYRKANAAQRRQIQFAAIGAFVVAGGMLGFLAFR